MIETHTIRLRGPWECSTGGGRLRRIHMPAAISDVAQGAGGGRLLCRRRFGCPTCLDPHEEIWLVVEHPALAGEARLNGERLGAVGSRGETASFDITGRLGERNELILELELSEARGEELLFGEVRLEIRG